MLSIDIGDLSLKPEISTRQEALYLAIKEKVLSGCWRPTHRLPASRALAVHLSISRNTVIAAYEQLKAEGYIDSKRGSGFFVTLNAPEKFLAVSPDIQPEIKNIDTSINEEILASQRNRPFRPGVPDLEAFPYLKWRRILNRHTSRPIFAGQNSVQGTLALRRAVSQYLASSRSVECGPENVIVTQGAQQALFIAASAILRRGDRVAIEDPGYQHATKIFDILNVVYNRLMSAQRAVWILASYRMSKPDVYTSHQVISIQWEPVSVHRVG